MVKNFLYKGKRLDTKKQVKDKSNNTKKQLYTPTTFFNIKNLPQHPIRTIKDLWIDIKYFCHRGKYGWADIDWFNMDNHLLHLIPDMLDQLAEKSYGYQENFVNADGNKVENMTPEDWKNYLLEITQHFRNADEDQTPIENNILDDRQAWFKKACEISEWRLKEVQKGLKMLGDNFFQLWD